VPRTIPLTLARRELSPLVREAAAGAAEVGISVHGEVKAYLVSPRCMAELRARATSRSPIQGSLTITGDLDAAHEDFLRELERSARRTAKQLRG
jgi:prevent-host-death family protein